MSRAWPRASRCALLVLLRDHPGRGEAGEQHREAARGAAVRLGLLLARHALAYDVRAEEADRLGREAPLYPVDERAAAPLVVAAECQRGEDLAPDDAGSDAIAREADAEDDVLPAAEVAEDRQAMARAIDG